VPRGNKAGIVSVIVDVPVPVRVDGLNDAVTPVGSPVALNVIEPLKLSCTSTTSVSVTPPILGGAKRLVTLGASVKSAVFTIKVVDAVCAIAVCPVPLCPVIAKVYVRAAVCTARVTVSVDVPDVVIEAGLKLAVAPVGRPEALKFTVPVNPVKAPTVTE
jgi:hypothetical protein